MPTTRIVPGRRPGTGVRRLHDRPEHPSSYPNLAAPLSRTSEAGPGLTARGGRSASYYRSSAPQMPAIIQWWRGGTLRETSSHPGGPPAGAPAPACSVAAVTLSDHQPEPRGDPRPGRRAGSHPASRAGVALPCPRDAHLDRRVSPGLGQGLALPCHVAGELCPTSAFPRRARLGRDPTRHSQRDSKLPTRPRCGLP